MRSKERAACVCPAFLGVDRVGWVCGGGAPPQCSRTVFSSAQTISGCRENGSVFLKKLNKHSFAIEIVQNSPNKTQRPKTTVKFPWLNNIQQNFEKK
jgi:hypothetical protein